MLVQLLIESNSSVKLINKRGLFFRTECSHVMIFYILLAMNGRLMSANFFPSNYHLGAKIFTKAKESSQTQKTMPGVVLFSSVYFTFIGIWYHGQRLYEQMEGLLWIEKHTEIDNLSLVLKSSFFCDMCVITHCV